MIISGPGEIEIMSQDDNWIDISVPISGKIVRWPGDPPVQVERRQDIDAGDEVTVSHLSFGAHIGTHIDAPLHYLRSGKSIDRMSLATTVGPARVIEIRDLEEIRVNELQAHGIRSGERLLFKTRNSTLWSQGNFVEDFVHLATEAAQYLATQGVRVVGIDYLSVGGYEKNGDEVHRILLGANVWILEGLDLSGVGPGPYELVCLPLKIEDGEAAPARAILRPL